MIAAVIVASLVVVAFLLVCVGLRIVDVAAQSWRTAQEGLATVRDPDLDDDAKEKAAQSAAIALFRAFFAVLWRALVATLVSGALIFAADALQLAAADQVMATLESWKFIVVASVILTALWIAGAAWQRRRR